MNVLLLGSGGREHALAWKIAQSKLISKLYIAPGNAGTRLVGENVPIGINDFEGIRKFILKNDIQLLVVGPEEPLVKGIVNFMKSDPLLRQLDVVGPDSMGARLEGSKDFAKAFMYRHNIPTAAYRSFSVNEVDAAKEFFTRLEPPFVIKADGLAAGKGVVICDDVIEAEAVLDDMLINSRFGEASSKVIIEEFLTGVELSVFVVTDGKSWKLLPIAKDYKRISEGDTGPNTGGMGSVSPVTFADESFMKKVTDQVIVPTVQGLKDEKIEYKGFIFIGLINVGGNPYVIEYNVRLGDPETESVIPRIKSDIVPLLQSLCNGTLHNQIIETDPRCAVTVMMVSAGYPGAYPKGLEVYDLDKVTESLIFHAGTSLDEKGEKVITSGGRVIAVTALAADIPQAREICYRTATVIDYLGKTYRKDIGLDILK